MEHFRAIRFCSFNGIGYKWENPGHYFVEILEYPLTFDLGYWVSDGFCWVLLQTPNDPFGTSVIKYENVD